MIYTGPQGIVGHIHWSIALPATIIAVMGILIAYLIYGRQKYGIPQKIMATWPVGYRVLSKKLYFDEVYLFITHKIIFNVFAKAAATFDRKVVDGGVNEVSDQTRNVAWMLTLLQNGQTQWYGLGILVGIVFFICLSIFLGLA